MPKLIKPAYLHHKATGQARCRINGKDHYLGSYGSPQSREKYDELIDEWFTRNGDMSRHDLTIDDLAILFLKFAENYYRRENGESTGEAKNVRDSLRPLIRQFGETAFGSSAQSSSSPCAKKWSKRDFAAPTSTAGSIVSVAFSSGESRTSTFRLQSSKR